MAHTEETTHLSATSQRCGMECFYGQQSPLWSSTCLLLCSLSPHCASTRWPDSCPLPSSWWASLDQFVGESSPVQPSQVCTRQQGRGWSLWRLLFLVLDSRFVSSSSPSSGYLLPFSSAEALLAGPDAACLTPVAPSSDGNWVYLGTRWCLANPATHVNQSLAQDMMSIPTDGQGQEQIWFNCQRQICVETNVLQHEGF